MPRVIHRPASDSNANTLESALVDELRAQNRFGQPIVDERQLSESGAVHVVVIWDRWDKIPDDQRTQIIQDAYTTVEGQEFVNRMRVASGLTFPEAYELGMLPFAIVPLIRNSERHLESICMNAMKKAQASELFPRGGLQLRFTSLEQAEACREFLLEQAPGTEFVWTISQEVPQRWP